MRGTWQGGGTFQTSGGGGRLVLGIIIAAVLVGSGAAAAVVRALETILVVALCGVGAMVVLGVAWIVWQMHLDRAYARQAAAGAAYQVPPAGRVPLESRSTPIAAGQLHLHFHGLPDDQVAAIIRKAIPGTAGDAAPPPGRNPS